MSQVKTDSVNRSLSPSELYKAMDEELKALKDSKAYKYEVLIDGRMGPTVNVGGKQVVMLASNNYLGLANHPDVVKAAQKGIDEYGYGMSSVRFLCGTQKIHLELEDKIASFVGQESAILHSSCFGANEAFFTAILQSDYNLANYNDMIFSDKLNHASIIDGIRLARIACKNTLSKPYNHNDLGHLQELIKDTRSNDNYRLKIIATDGVFSMEGDYADLKALTSLAKAENALLFVDDSHSTGVLGANGRGTSEQCDVLGQVDVITGTFGKALGGAHGGFIAGKASLIEYIRQKSRPYTFSNTLAPMITMASIKAIDILSSNNELVQKLHANTAYFRKSIQEIGFKILPGIHPIVAIMLGETQTAQILSNELLNHGVYIKGLWYPVVPKGEARLRAQISASHSQSDLDKALMAFEKCGKSLKII